jgi:molybdopterin-biosynthesis enzyme MoeA-like protein
MLYFSGYDVYRGLIVPDVKEEIGNAFRSLIGKCDVIVSSGGLGPTFDDMTVSSFAQEFDIALRRDKETYTIIKFRTEKKQLKMTKEREKMALIPDGSIAIKNEVGTAPGVDYKIEATRIFILPGVPAEMRSMLRYVEREIKLKDSFYFEDSTKIHGIYEATLAPYVSELMKRYSGRVYIKSHPLVDEGGESALEVEVSAKADRFENSKNVVNEVLAEIKMIVSKLRRVGN